MTWSFLCRGSDSKPFNLNFSHQGKFPTGDTAEDGFHGVSPVKAFPPQNDYGMVSHAHKSVRVFSLMDGAEREREALLCQHLLPRDPNGQGSGGCLPTWD